MIKNKYSYLRNVAFVALLCASSISYGMEGTNETPRTVQIKPDKTPAELKEELEKITLKEGIAHKKSQKTNHKADREEAKTRKVNNEIETQAVKETREKRIQASAEQADRAFRLEQEETKNEIQKKERKHQQEKQWENGGFFNKIGIFFFGYSENSKT